MFLREVCGSYTERNKCTRTSGNDFCHLQRRKEQHKCRNRRVSAGRGLLIRFFIFLRNPPASTRSVVRTSAGVLSRVWGWGAAANRCTCLHSLLRGNGNRIQRAVTAVELREGLLQHGGQTRLVALSNTDKGEVDTQNPCTSLNSP